MTRKALKPLPNLVGYDIASYYPTICNQKIVSHKRKLPNFFSYHVPDYVKHVKDEEVKKELIKEIRDKEE